MREHYSIRLEIIEIGERHRALSDTDCRKLAQSMSEIGLQHPITIRMVEEMEIDGAMVSGVPVLVAGAHRIAAAKLLGWTEIDCIEVDADALMAELWEIDENLMRAELTAAQEAEHLSRRKRVWKAINANVVREKRRGRPKDFASETAKAAGISSRAVQKQIQRADKLGPDLRLIAGTSLDSGVEMDALGALDPNERHELAERAAAGEKVSARKPVVVPDPINPAEVSNKYRARLMAAWNAAPAEDREWFLARVDTPVMDRRHA